MYILGHLLLTTAMSSVDRDYAVERGIRALMLPDFADTHAFAYTHAWERAGDTDSRLIRSHIAGDWWIHFGDNLTDAAWRRGWAYLKMGVVSRRYEEFYAEAFARGLTGTAEPNDSRRGWAHSMLEYSVDTYIARTGVLDDTFEAIRDQLGSLSMHADEVRTMFASQQVLPWSQAVWSNAGDYSTRVALSQSPEDFAVIGAAGKFGLDYSPEAREFVRSYQSAVVENIGADEYDMVIDAMHDFVAAVEHDHFRPAIPGPPLKSRREALLRDARNGQAADVSG
jgi:phosphoglycolate phosphatase-like HAD superfamily hydrolase